MESAATASTLADVGGLQALHAFGLDRIAVVQAMDPAAYMTLRTSLDSLMGGLQVGHTTCCIPACPLCFALVLLYHVWPAHKCLLQLGLQNLVTQNGELAMARGAASSLSMEALPWTNGLVLSVQQLVTALRTPAAANMSMESMVAAQQALQLAVAGATVDATGLATTAAGEASRLQICKFNSCISHLGFTHSVA